MLVSDLYARVWDRLGEDPDSPVRYTQYMLREFLCEAVEQWTVRVGGKPATQTISLVADQLEYKLTGDPVRVLSVIEDTNNLPLQPASYGDLYRLQGWDWRSVNSNRPTHYSLFSLDEIWLWPPLSSVTSETVTVTYQESFSLLNGDTLETTDEVPIPQEFHVLLVEYLVGRCQLFGVKDENRLNRAIASINAWVEGLEKIRDLRSNRAA